jgi:vancomycin resistance protein YoaR
VTQLPASWQSTGRGRRRPRRSVRAARFVAVVLLVMLAFSADRPRGAQAVGGGLGEAVLGTSLGIGVQSGPDASSHGGVNGTSAVTTARATACVAAHATSSCLGIPLQLWYRGRTFALTPSELSQIVSFDPADCVGEFPLTFDTEEGNRVLGKLLADLEVPAKDAELVPLPGGKSFGVLPAANGVQIDWDLVYPAMARAVLGPAPHRALISIKPEYPKITTEDLLQLASKKEIVSFETYFSAENQARAHNIEQTAHLLNNTVVRPGETFSFNQVVGPRTRAAGFDEAPVIMGGVLVLGVGGGTCQASTTLFNAVLLAGLPIVERHPHEFFIDHYPIGRDATVDYGTADLRFRNDSSEVLLISASATDHSLRVSLAAPTWDRSVSLTCSEFRDVVGPSSSPAHPRRVLDLSLAPKQTLPIEPGVDGKTVEVKRVVRTKEGRALFADTFTSEYKPKDYILRYGG